MKSRLAIVAVGLQVLALAYMAGEREWILRTGRTVWLRTAPIDPRDFMRGDYVRLGYEISSVERALWRDGLTNTPPTGEQARPDVKVYAGLQVAPTGRAEITSLSDRPPAQGLFLRGRTESSWGDILQVRYGIEAFFMEQGRAQALEDERNRDRNGVPLNMEVALGHNGIGVLKGYRWESLGITVDFENRRRTNRAAGLPFPIREEVITAAKVELKNHGPEPIAIVNLPEGRSLALVPDARFGEARYRWVGDASPRPRPRPEDIVVLQPGESRSTRLDLTRPEWFVVSRGSGLGTTNAMPIHRLEQPWSAPFRLEYRPPSVEECAGLPNASLIYHDRLPSRTFTPRGMTD